jgi:alkaline phosphatase
VVPQGYDPRPAGSSSSGPSATTSRPFGILYTSYTDSASAGTALHAGIKTIERSPQHGLDRQLPFRTIAEIAMDQGRAAGAVSSVQVSHATPASVMAHNVSRNDYAEDLQRDGPASDLTVIMGAGHPFFDDSGNRREPAADDDRAFRFLGGRETVAALTGNEGLNGFTFIDDKAAFEALAGASSCPSEGRRHRPVAQHAAGQPDGPARGRHAVGHGLHPDGARPLPR